MDAVPLIDLISSSLVVIAMIMQTASLDGSPVTESSTSPDVNTTTMPTSSSSSLMGIDRNSITQSRANHTFIIPASPATTNISSLLPDGATEGSDIRAAITTQSDSTIVSPVWLTRDTNEGATTLSPGVDNSTVIMSTDSKSVGNWSSSTEMGNLNSSSWTLNTTRSLVDVTLRDEGTSDAMVATAHPTLDKSFSTKEFWVVMELAVAMNTHIHDAVYLRHLEGSLARGFNTASKRKEAKNWEIAQLLEKLDTEGDIPLRKRRASTVEGSTAQIIDLSRNADDPSIGELVFYISRGGAGIPATDCAATLTELSVQELTLIMGIVVLSAVSSFNPVPTMVPQSAGPSRTLLLALLIPLSALLTFLCCCCLCCTLCGPKRKKNQRVMTPNTFKMLEFKQKFPYKPYHPNVTHIEDLRQRSEVDNADQESSGEDGSVDTTSKTQIIPMDGTDHQRAPLGYSDAEGVVNEGLDGTTRTTEIPDPSSCDPVEKEGQLPPLPLTQRTNKQYTEEQKRISEILEPEKIPKRTQKKRRRRRNSVGAVPSTKQRGNLSGMNTRKQDEHSKPLSDTKLRVHDLIEEAFSLVSFKATPTSHVTELGEEAGEATDSHDTCVELSAIPIETNPPGSQCGAKREFGVQTSALPGATSIVVVVPMDTMPADVGSVVWNPYTARDELVRMPIHTEQLTLPGRAEESTSDTPTNTPLPSTVTHVLAHGQGATEYSDSDRRTVSPLDNGNNHQYSMRDGTAMQYSLGADYFSELEDLSPSKSDVAPHGSRNVFGDLTSLTEFERERRNRPGNFHDELDLTSAMSRGRPSASLTDTIRAEYTGADTSLSQHVHDTAGW